MKRFFSFTACLVALLVFFGCGGGNIFNTIVPTPTVRAFTVKVSGIPNYLTTAFKTTTIAATSRSRFSDVANAQSTPAAVMVGNYSGFCPQVQTNFLPTGTQGEYTMFGLGYLPPFGNTSSVGCGDHASFIGPGSAPQFDSPAPVIGAGTLQGLVVLDSRDSQIAPGSGVFHVYVIRAGQTIDTGISATLGGSATHRASNTTTTYAVQDGDGIIVTGVFAGTDAPKNLQIFIGKQ